MISIAFNAPEFQLQWLSHMAPLHHSCRHELWAQLKHVLHTAGSIQTVMSIKSLGLLPICFTQTALCSSYALRTQYYSQTMTTSAIISFYSTATGESVWEYPVHNFKYKRLWRNLHHGLQLGYQTSKIWPPSVTVTIATPFILKNVSLIFSSC
jgi:hypothetical protein